MFPSQGARWIYIHRELEMENKVREEFPFSELNFLVYFSKHTELWVWFVQT